MFLNSCSRKALPVLNCYRLRLKNDTFTGPLPNRVRVACLSHRTSIHFKFLNEIVEKFLNEIVHWLLALVLCTLRCP